MTEISQNTEARKSGRPIGTLKPDAACRNMPKMREQRRVANHKFKMSGGYVKLKIRMNCKNHNIEVPDLTSKTLGELNNILFEIKLNNFTNKNNLI